jgi:hypothetical protein
MARYRREVRGNALPPCCVYRIRLALPLPRDRAFVRLDCRVLIDGCSAYRLLETIHERCVVVRRLIRPVDLAESDRYDDYVTVSIKEKVIGAIYNRSPLSTSQLGPIALKESTACFINVSASAGRGRASTVACQEYIAMYASLATLYQFGAYCLRTLNSVPGG